MGESKREMDTFINVTVKGSAGITKEVVREDLNLAIESVVPVAKKLSAFRKLANVITRRETFVDYEPMFGTSGEYGTLITTSFIGNLQPEEDDKDRLNSMIPGIIQSSLMETGHYSEVIVTL